MKEKTINKRLKTIQKELAEIRRQLLYDPKYQVIPAPGLIHKIAETQAEVGTWQNSWKKSTFAYGLKE